MPENVQIQTTSTRAQDVNINSEFVNSCSSTPPSHGQVKSLSGTTFGQHREEIFRKLKVLSEQCKNSYAGKKELATEQDDYVSDLCDTLEEVFSYGLKQQQAAVVVTAASILQNMQEIVTGNIGGPSVSSTLDTTFWDFCEMHLTAHERERYDSLRKVWTKHGRGKAFIRSALNEKSLQRYLLIWLDDEMLLKRYYTSWSFFLNEEAAKELPIIAGTLNEVLFALTIDATELNVATRFAQTRVVREEPIINAPAPVPVIACKHKRNIEMPVEQAKSAEIKLDAETNCTAAGVPNSSVLAFNESIAQVVYTNEEHQPTDPIEPELAFLKEPLPEFHAAVPVAIDQPFNSSPEIEYEDKSDTSSQYSKSSQSANGAVSQTMLENQLQDALDRCALLETRVAQLSLENRQLVRRLTQFFKDTGIDPSSSSSSYFLITIPLAKLNKTRTGSAYYTYEIHITMRRHLEHWSVIRRYRDFHKLHKSLLRTHPTVASVEFPPKKHFGNMNLVFVEERRQQLQIYLINLVETLPQVEACKTKPELQKVFPFFR